MDCCILKINWHDENMPVYSLDWQKSTVGDGNGGGRNLAVNESHDAHEGCKDNGNGGTRSNMQRLVTGGGDNHIRLWSIDDAWDMDYNQVQDGNDNTKGPKINYLSTLTKHSQAVNVVRFSHHGLLASASDDGTIIIWGLSPTVIKSLEHDFDDAESWIVHKLIKTNAEIIDLAWSPDDKYVVVGLMDNTVKIINVDTGKIIEELTSHHHYVQGVAWDPLDKFIVSQSADKCVNIYNKGKNGIKLMYKVMRSELPNYKLDPSEWPDDDTMNVDNDETRGIKNRSLYHSETLQSFFRRLQFSPDGNLLVTPSGLHHYGNDEVGTNTVYIMLRNQLNKPIIHLPGLTKPAVCISFSPNLYTLQPHDGENVFNFPYRMIFAVATQDSIIIYDTQHLQPLGMVNNIHYSTVTDLSWDNNRLIASSTDGFCSLVKFNDLGELYHGDRLVIETLKVNNDKCDTTNNDNNQKSEPEIIVVSEKLEEKSIPERKVNSIDNLIRKKEKKRVIPTVVKQE